MSGSSHCARHREKGPNASCYAWCRCRCEGCGEEKRRRDARWRATRRRLDPQPQHLCDARRARAALQAAVDAGCTDRQIAALLGTSSSWVWQVRNGRTRRIHRGNGARVVAAAGEAMRRPARADGLVVAARLRWLRERGASDVWIAEQVGWSPAHAWHLRVGHVAAPRRETADRVEWLVAAVAAGELTPPGHGANAVVGQVGR